MPRPPLPTLTAPPAEPEKEILNAPVVEGDDGAKPSSVSAAEAAAADAVKTKAAGKDVHKLKLSRPLLAGDRTLTELNLDCRPLTGADFRAFASEFRMKYTTTINNIVYDERFRFLVIAKLNSIPEADLDGLAFSDAITVSGAMLYFFLE